MEIILNHSSMVPIYEQIGNQIKELIMQSKLHTGDPLPSVRQLAGELHISALTVKKAYDALTETGLVATVPGKGSYVQGLAPQLEREELIRSVQGTIDKAVLQARSLGLTDNEISEMFQLALED